MGPGLGVGLGLINGILIMSNQEQSGTTVMHVLNFIIRFAYTTHIATPTARAVETNLKPYSTSTLQRKKQAFSTKLQDFKVVMARLGFAQSSRLKFNIRRENLLEDAYEHMMRAELRHLQRKRLNISFRGEEG